MKEYKIKIKETLEMVVSIEAESISDAKKLAEERWKNSEYVLDYSNFEDVSFHPLNRNRDHER